MTELLINILKNLSTANSVVSGIGTLTGGAGTITSILANSKNAEVGPGTLFSGKIVNAFQIRLKLND